MTFSVVTLDERRKNAIAHFSLAVLAAPKHFREISNFLSRQS
jgi:hypothetical protein